MQLACAGLKCIEHIKVKRKVREFKVLVRLNFGANFKEKMFNVLDKLTGEEEGDLDKAARSEE